MIDTLTRLHSHCTNKVHYILNEIDVFSFRNPMTVTQSFSHLVTQPFRLSLFQSASDSVINQSFSRSVSRSFGQSFSQSFSHSLSNAVRHLVIQSITQSVIHSDIHCGTQNLVIVALRTHLVTQSVIQSFRHLNTQSLVIHSLSPY